MDSQKQQQQQQQQRASDLRVQLGAMSVDNASVPAGPGDGGAGSAHGPAGAGVDGGGGEAGSRRPSGLGPDDRKRALVASMSPEDIVLCVDIGVEMSSDWAKAGAGGTVTSRMRVVQAALMGFVRSKASFNPNHRFAVVALGDGVTVILPLTSDVRSVLEAIDRLQPQEGPLVDGDTGSDGEGEAPFDFSELLKCVSERFPPPKEPASMMTERNRGVASAVGVGPAGGGVNGAGALPQVRPVVRALLVYGRSFTCPLVPPGGAEKPPLLSHGRFVLDCLYLHRKPSDEGVVCREAFDLIATMETSGGGGHSYLLECGHNLLRLNTNMAALLAHPFQRDYQAVFFEKLAVPGGSAAVGTHVMRGDNNANNTSGVTSGGSSAHGAVASATAGSAGGFSIV